VVPDYVKESFAQVTKRTFKVRSSIAETLIRYGQYNPAFKELLLKEGLWGALLGQRSLEADDLIRVFEIMAKNNIVIPEEIV